MYAVFQLKRFQAAESAAWSQNYRSNGEITSWSWVSQQLFYCLFDQMQEENPQSQNSALQAEDSVIDPEQDKRS